MKSLSLVMLLLLFNANIFALPDYCPKTMTLVFYGNWYPYMFEEEGQYKGIDYEFMKLIMDKLNCDINVNAIPEKRAHQGLARGDSLIMSGATITPERSKYAYFSNPYREETMSLFYLLDPKNQAPQMSATEVMLKSNIIAINGAAYYGPLIEKLRKSQYQDKFTHVPSLARRIEMLLRNRAQSMIEDQIAACYSLHKTAPEIANQIKSVEVNQVKVAFMFSKGVVPYGFIAIFNDAMQQLIAQGAYVEIATKYTPQGC